MNISSVKATLHSQSRKIVSCATDIFSDPNVLTVKSGKAVLTVARPDGEYECSAVFKGFGDAEVDDSDSHVWFLQRIVAMIFLFSTLFNIPYIFTGGLVAKFLCAGVVCSVVSTRRVIQRFSGKHNGKIAKVINSDISAVSMMSLGRPDRIGRGGAHTTELQAGNCGPNSRKCAWDTGTLCKV